MKTDLFVATIQQLAARKQRYKLSMFTRLHRILLGVILIVAAFFVVSLFSFSNRLAEGRTNNIFLESDFSTTANTIQQILRLTPGRLDGGY